MPKPDISENSFRVLHILSRNNAASQRDLANQSGLSLGMVNLILKRLTKTGYIKIITLDGRKLRYLLTPEGLSEKTRRSYRYLVRTIRIYDQYRQEIDRLIDEQLAAQHRKFLIYGEGDLADLVHVILKRKDPAVHVRISNRTRVLQHSSDEVILNCYLNGEKPVHGISVLEEVFNATHGVKEGELYELV